ncbi:hypothetical protein KF707_13530 [Candidatus Obscuribacterales bacterium]|nr:hypothetical protein [Candidatus Obscuribacterales bacterium]
MINLRKLLSNPLIYVTILATAVLICFGRTLGSYFLADDFGEVAYVSKIFEGDWARLWSNFTGNYMQVPSMAVYRPWLLMTLFFDYSIWKTNAAGYYATNLLHYLACTILIFTLVRLLTSYWGKLRSNLAATFSGLLFAVNPLHCESVSWVVGRVDIVCLTYYLLGLVSVALYVRNQNKKWLILTFASFWLGILTKEMAIALPVTATVLAFLWAKPVGSQNPKSNVLNFQPDENSQEASQLGNVTDSGTSEPSRATALAALQKLDQELQAQHSSLTASSESPSPAIAKPIASPANLSGTPSSNSPSSTPVSPLSPSILMEKIKVTVPVAGMLFACTVVYFIIRYAALGTITGGYTGSIGDSQISGILQKWTDLDTISRILFPFNQFVFADDTAHKTMLTVLYVALTALAGARLLVGATPRRWLVFLFFATVAVLAPIYQLWGIGYNLEGSRFVFFLTVPLSMLFPIILFAPLERRGSASESATANKTLNGAGIKIVALSVLALVGLTAAYAKTTLRNNIPWVHAGKQTDAITKKAQALSKSTPDGSLVCVVGIPKDEGGAHMILNGTTFRHLITPPFAGPGLTGKILTFEPVLFGNPEKIDTAHFKQALKLKDVRAYFVWDMDKKDFVPFDPGAPPVVPQPFRIPLSSGPTQETDQSSSDMLTGSLASFPYTRQRGDVDAKGLVENANAGLGIRVSGLKLRPAAFDYMVINCKLPGNSTFRGTKCKVHIESTDGKKTDFESDFFVNDESIRIPLSAYWRFYAAGELASIVVDLPPISELAVDGVALLPDSFVAPTITAVGRHSSNEGSFVVDNRLNNPKSPGSSKNSKTRAVVEGGASPSTENKAVTIAVNATSLKDAQSIEVQVLRKNFFFDNFTSEAALINGTEQTFNTTGNIATVNLPAKLFTSSGYIQLRARALNGAKQQTGEYSAPITLRVLTD